MSFEPGDVVQLKSGGPKMTVEWIEVDQTTNAETVACIWFEEVGRRQEVASRTFATFVLQKYEPMGALSAGRI